MRGTLTRLRADLLLHLVARDFQIRYRRSVIGGLWSVAQPLTRLVVLSCLFTRILPLGIEDYTAFLFIGLMGWLWFSSGLISACASPVDRRELILRPGVPRAIVPVVSVLGAGMDYLAAFPVLLGYLLLTTGIPPTAVLLPGLLAIQLVLMLGISFALAAANVFVRDVRIVTEVALLLGFYVTPVFFSPEQVPDRFQLLLTLNPMAGLLEMQRDVLLRGVLPEATQVAASTLTAVVIGALGYAVYRRASPHFADEL